MPVPGRQRSERHVIAFLATTAALMAFGIDASLPAFDEIRPALDLPEDSNRVTRIVTFYFLGIAAGQLVYGPLADRFGRIPVLQVGLGLYMVGAIGSALTPNFEFLLAARLLWGFGAAAPSLLRTTIARDLYRGDQMARVISIVMAFFLLGPVLAPLISEGILAVGSWRAVFWVATVLAGALMVWTARFGETLDPENRRPLRAGPTLDAIRLVLRTRVTIAHTLAMTFALSAFFVHLSSAQPIFDVIYGRAAWFAPLFGAEAALMAVGFFTVPRFILRHGAQRVAVAVMVATIAVSVVLLAWTVAADGRPGFWTWFVLIALANTSLTLLTPTGMSLALEPMGALAGTASGVVGLVSMAGSSLLATWVNSLIVDTVTPLVWAYLGFGGLALVCVLAAGPQAVSDT